MKSILKKELKTYFESMSGYVYLAIFFAITAYYFTVNNLLAQSNDISQYFQNMILALMFMIPVLTMRLLSEEKKMKTEQLLLTIPLKIREILMGKFLAAWIVFLAGIVFTFIFVIILVFLGGVDLYTVSGCYAGMILAGSCFLAIGIFLSSVTENQTIAAIVTYAVLFGLYIVSLLGNYTSNAVVTKIIDYIALFRRYTDFTMGIFDVSAAFYYLSLTIAFLVFSGYILTKKRKGNAAILVLTVLILIFSNFFVSGLSDRYSLQFDMTASGLYKISRESIELVKDLDKEVDIYCVCKSRDAIVEFSEMLDKYDAASKNIHVQYVDPYSNVIYLDQLKEEGYDVGLNTIVVECDGNRRILKMSSMYAFSSDGTELAYFQGESMITSAIINVAREDSRTVGIVMGHGEEVGEQFQQLFLENGCQVAGVVLNQPVNEEVDTLIVDAPQTDFSDYELEMLDEFFLRGGSLMYFRDPSAGALSNIEEFLGEWGIWFREDVIFDSKYNIESNPVNVIGYYDAHEITKYFENHNYYTVVPASSSIEDDFSNSAGCTVESVLATSDAAYGRELDTDQLTTERIASDTKGPFILAVTSVRTATSGAAARIFASGSKRIASDDMLRLTSVGNSKLMAQVIRWCTDSDGAAFSIPAKQVGGEPIAVTKVTAYTVGGICVVLLPLLLLLPGVLVCVRRRRL